MRRFPQPDPGDVTIEVLHCFGCGRKLGVAAAQKMAVYCEEMCWHKEQLVAFDQASRNRAIVYLVDRLGINVTDSFAAAFGITRARVNQVLAQSNGNYLLLSRKETPTDDDRAAKARAGKLGGSSRWSGKAK